MKKFMQNWGRKVRYAAIVAASTIATSAKAEGESYTGDASNLPSAMTEAIEDLEHAAADYGAAIFPYIAKVGLAFVGIGVFYLLFRVWRRFAGGR